MKEGYPRAEDVLVGTGVSYMINLIAKVVTSKSSSNGGAMLSQYGLAPKEITGFSQEEFPGALSMMEDSIDTGQKVRVTICTEGVPTPEDLDTMYLGMVVAGCHVSQPVFSMIEGIPTTEFILQKGSPSFAVVAGLLPTLFILGLVAFGIARLESIVKTLMPLVLVVLGGMVILAVVARKPATEYLGTRKLLPATKKKPKRSDVRVEVWEERDRLHIGIQDKDTGGYYVSWWDEEARQMFEDGFFKRGRDLKESVLDYAESMGILAGSGKRLPALTAKKKEQYLALNEPYTYEVGRFIYDRLEPSTWGEVVEVKRDHYLAETPGGKRVKIPIGHGRAVAYLIYNKDGAQHTVRPESFILERKALARQGRKPLDVRYIPRMEEAVTPKTVEGEPIPDEYKWLIPFMDEPLPEETNHWLPAVTPEEGESKIVSVLKRLSQGVEGIQDSSEFRRFLTAMSRFHQYSISNLILIALQKPQAAHVAGYNTWKSLGRQVKAGERGIFIIGPVMPRKVKREKAEGEEEEEEIALTPVNYKVVYVFDISQTEGEPLPEFDVPVLTGEANEELFARVLALAGDQGLEVSFNPRPNQDPSIKGSYSGKSIWVRPEESRAQQLKSLLHELSHYYSEGVFRIPRRDAETIAESAAYAVGAHFGFDTGDRSFPYVALWSQDKKVLDKNLESIRRVVKVMLKGMEAAQVPEVALPAFSENGDIFIDVGDHVRYLGTGKYRDDTWPEGSWLEKGVEGTVVEFHAAEPALTIKGEYFPGIDAYAVVRWDFGGITAIDRDTEGQLWERAKKLMAKVERNTNLGYHSDEPILPAFKETFGLVPKDKMGSFKSVTKKYGTRMFDYLPDTTGEKKSIFVWEKGYFPAFEYLLHKTLVDWSKKMDVSEVDYIIADSVNDIYYSDENQIVIPAKLAKGFKKNDKDFMNLLFCIAHEFSHWVAEQKGMVFLAIEEEESFANKTAEELSGVQWEDSLIGLHKYLPEIWKTVAGNMSLEEAIEKVKAAKSKGNYLAKTYILQDEKLVPALKPFEPYNFAEYVLRMNRFMEAEIPIYSGLAGKNPLRVPDHYWREVIQELDGEFVKQGDVYIFQIPEKERPPYMRAAPTWRDLASTIPENGHLNRQEAEYLNTLRGYKLFEPGKSIRESLKAEGSLPGESAVWEEKLKKMPGRVKTASEILNEQAERLEDRISNLDDEIDRLEDAGKSTAAMEKQRAALEKELNKLLADEAKPSNLPAGNDRLPSPREEKLFVSDSPEFLAHTIESIGYREKLDQAFEAAIAKANAGG